ncbi:MAG TPA: S-methyl-5-thioribose-1-phosphate isomerase [Planctomycetota bacterium]|nr:S-methyl-5-thioribose-1-phosphate isomerase [Planctomycetota bacterium]
MGGAAPAGRDFLPPIETVSWRDGAVRLIDQRRLPAELVHMECRTVPELFSAIRELAVRGAPAIGVAAGYGAVMAVWKSRSGTAGLLREVAAACKELAASRPTAVNLFWALDRMNRTAESLSALAPEEFRERLLAEARAIHEEDLELSRRMGRAGAELIPDGATVLTHCNAGALATGGLGTALACVYAAVAEGKRVSVLADETRPLLQGARLTAWELSKAGIPVTVLCDNMAAAAMQQGRVDLVITGADRIAANGDAANKIGTYGVAVNAKHHGVPFYIAAPESTFDRACLDGSKIVIEERSAAEVLGIAGWVGRGQEPEARSEAEGSVPVPGVWNPAFDVTPAELIAGLITDRGVLRAPYGESIAAAFGGRG